MIISYSFHGFKILISSSFCKYTRFLTFHQIFQILFHLNYQETDKRRDRTIEDITLWAMSSYGGQKGPA